MSAIPGKLPLLSRYNRVDVLLLWMLAPLFFSIPPALCGFLLIFLAVYPWLPATLRARQRWIILCGLCLGVLVGALSLPTWFSGETLLAAIALVAVLKRAELHTERDRMVLLVAVFVVNTLHLIYWNNLPALVHLLSMVGLMLWVAQLGAQTPVRQRVMAVWSTVLWSLPLALILFLFVPRVSGPLWDVGLAFGLPISIYQDVISTAPAGNRDGMAENNVLASLQAQRQVVLVADFLGAMPSKSRLYWRGAVSYRYGDGQWISSTAGTTRSQRLSTAYRNIDQYHGLITHQQEPVSYRIKVAPHKAYWLYAPDLPMKNAQESFISQDGQLLAIRPVIGEFSYKSSSFLDAKILPTEVPAVLDSELPAEDRAFIQNTADMWRVDTLGVLDVDAVNNNDQKKHTNVISLEIDGAVSDGPGAAAVDINSKKNSGEQSSATTTNIIGNHTAESLLRGHMLDFLAQPPAWFDASPPFSAPRLQRWVGVTMLMLQQAGLPARMVSGYRGGDLIALTDVIVVREKHRHHWLEVWSSKVGWERIEVQDILSRSNLAKGLENKTPAKKTKPQQQEAPLDTPPSTASKNDEPEVSWLNKIEQWLRGYTPKATVSSSAEESGVARTVSLPTWLWAPVLVFVWLLLFFLHRYFRQRPPIMEEAWNILVTALAQQGFHYQPWQCPSVILRAIERRQPEWQGAAKQLISTYLKYRYAADTPELSALSYRSQVKRFQSAVKHVVPNEKITTGTSTSEISTEFNGTDR